MGIAVTVVVFLNRILIGNQPETKSGFAVQPLSKGFSLAESGVAGGFYEDKLKSYPEPNKFRPLEYKNKDLEFSGECSDLYYTVLVYPKNIDYRKNPASAKVNQAFECPRNRKFKTTIGQNAGLAEEKYYIIIADQGEEGNWYNPR